MRISIEGPDAEHNIQRLRSRKEIAVTTRNETRAPKEKTQKSLKIGGGSGMGSMSIPPTPFEKKQLRPRLKMMHSGMHFYTLVIIFTGF